MLLQYDAQEGSATEKMVKSKLLILTTPDQTSRTSVQDLAIVPLLAVQLDASSRQL